MPKSGIEVSEKEFVNFAVSSASFPYFLTDQQAKLMYKSFKKKGWTLVDAEKFRKIRETVNKIPKPYYSILFSLEPWRDVVVKHVKELKKLLNSDEQQT